MTATLAPERTHRPEVLSSDVAGMALMARGAFEQALGTSPVEADVTARHTPYSHAELATVAIDDRALRDEEKILGSVGALVGSNTEGELYSYVMAPGARIFRRNSDGAVKASVIGGQGNDLYSTGWMLGRSEDAGVIVQPLRGQSIKNNYGDDPGVTTLSISGGGRDVDSLLLEGSIGREAAATVFQNAATIIGEATARRESSWLRKIARHRWGRLLFK